MNVSILQRDPSLVAREAYQKAAALDAEHDGKDWAIQAAASEAWQRWVNTRATSKAGILAKLETLADGSSDAHITKAVIADLAALGEPEAAMSLSLDAKISPAERLRGCAKLLEQMLIGQDLVGDHGEPNESVMWLIIGTIEEVEGEVVDLLDFKEQASQKVRAV